MWQPAVADLDGHGSIAAVALREHDNAMVESVVELLDAGIVGELKLVDQDGGSLVRAPSITVHEVKHERREACEAEALVGRREIPPWLAQRRYTGVVEAHDGFIRIS